MSLDAQEIDDLYTVLCYRLTEKGEPAMVDILARLTLLLMHETDDATRIRRAIDKALQPFPDRVAIERPY